MDKCERECGICLEKIRNKIILCCNHAFCLECIEVWVHYGATCPLCRHPITIAEVEPEDLASSDSDEYSLGNFPIIGSPNLSPYNWF
jgi:hypothetical protein